MPPKSPYFYSRRVYEKKKEFISYVKICVHEGEDRVAERKHLDWSGFTIIFHNDDIGEPCLNLAPFSRDGDHFYNPYKKSTYLLNNEIYTNGIIFPGNALRLAGIKMDPTPHFVSKVSKKRHSLLAFCMVPGVDCGFPLIE